MTPDPVEMRAAATVDQAAAIVRDRFDAHGLSLTDLKVSKTIQLFAEDVRRASLSSDPKLICLAVTASYLQAVRDALRGVLR